VLRQVADEEAFLFPSRTGSGTGQLARDHARLRSGIEALQRAADSGSPERLAGVTRDLLCQLERHLAAEPITTVSPSSRAPRSSGIRPMSIRVEGRAIHGPL
jgi:hypothetical protein